VFVVLFFAPACWLQALEKDLEDLKVQVVAVENVQEQLLGVQTQLAAAQSRQQLLQQELEQSRSKVTQLEYDLHGEEGAYGVSRYLCSHSVPIGQNRGAFVQHGEHQHACMPRPLHTRYSLQNDSTAHCMRGRALAMVVNLSPPCK
jgi:hypothetical protein